MSDSDLEKSPVSSKRAREASYEEPMPVDPKDQKKRIEELQEQLFKEGEQWCLIAKPWFDRWIKYCSRMGNPETKALGEKTPPGPIHNAPLFKNNRLAEDLVVNDNVFAVPMSAWNQLVEWYGVHDDTLDPVVRQIIESSNQLKIEIYPPQFRLYAIEHDENSFINPSIDRHPVITLSETSPVGDFLQAIRAEFDLTEETEIQAWILKDKPVVTTPPNISVSNLTQATLFELDDLDTTLSRSGHHNIAIETKSGLDQKYPSESSKQQNDTSSVSSTSSGLFANGFNKLSTSTPPPPSTSSTVVPVQPKFTRGVCGLQNLGNTCFMNSALQCLSNTSQLTKYFLADLYKTDLNPDNPLGMKGQVAEEYGELIKKLWSGQTSSIAPREFKYTLGRFNNSFSGYQQHDTQELLAFLLDGLHEDLNRIIKKPYVELPDFDGMKDTEIAKRSWDYHKARNDSVIVDLFQGQFKSRLICTQCQNLSVTFDPFMYLSLPLPIKKKSKTSVVYVPYDPSQKLQRMVVTLSKDASIGHLQKEVAKMMSVEDPNTLLIVEIFNHKIYKIIPSYEPVANIGSSDIIYIYQLPGPVPPTPKKSRHYHGYTRNSAAVIKEEEPEDPPVDENQLIVFPVYCGTVSSSPSTYQCDRVSQFGDPIVLAVPYKDANKPDLLYKLVSQHIERYTQFKLFEEVNETDESKVEEEEVLPPPPSYDGDDQMEIDDTQQQQQPQLIHTAAAVLPAGGRRMEPMSNLFAMKVFSSPRTSYQDDGLLPTIQNWTNLIDLRERAEKEYLQREEYYKQQQQQVSSSSSSSEAEEEEYDTEMEESITLPSKKLDEEDYEIVEDAATAYPQDFNEKLDTVEDVFKDDNEQIVKELTEDEEEDDDDFDSVKNHHLSDTDSDSQFANTENSPVVPIIPVAATLPKKTSSPPPPPLPTTTTKTTKTKPKVITLPPSTIIRQGEGILLEWTVKKAQQLFGNPRGYADENGVNTDAWEDMEDLGDPNLDSDQTKQPKQITLSDCLNEFTKEEELSEEDLWYCPKCKKHQRAKKKFDLWRIPEIMVVHLKRFSHSRTWRDKIDALIDFPITELDLTDRVLSIEDHKNIKDEDRLIYDLYAVDNHFGGLGGGHYTSYAQNFEDGHWYNFDDSHVTKVDVSAVKTPAAYLLFYKRRRTNDSTKNVETIIRDANEKQQAAEEESNSLLFQPIEQPSSLDKDDPHQIIAEDEPITEFSQMNDQEDNSDMLEPL